MFGYILFHYCHYRLDGYIVIHYLRKEDLLIKKEVLDRLWILRKVLHPMNTVDAMEFLIDKVQGTKTNAEFIEQIIIYSTP